MFQLVTTNEKLEQEIKCLSVADGDSDRQRQNGPLTLQIERLEADKKRLEDQIEAEKVAREAESQKLRHNLQTAHAQNAKLAHQ